MGQTRKKLGGKRGGESFAGGLLTKDAHLSFDQDEKTWGFAHGFDPYLTTHNGVAIHGIPKRPAIPVQPKVHILGRGLLPEDHYGFPPGSEIQGIDHQEFHLPPHIPPERRELHHHAEGGEGEEEMKAYGRFYQWHFDGNLYAIPPPRVGCPLAVRTPKGPDGTTGQERK